MTDRRTFLMGTAATAGAAALTLPGAVHAAGTDVIRVGVVGCGGRGSGAAKDSLESDKSVKVVALGDFFLDRAQGTAKNLAKQYGDRVQPGEHVYGGLDAYKNVIGSGVDLVILATPPGFRPLHLEAAIDAGMHVFCEKPVAVDGPGIKKVLELAEKAKSKNLAVVAGTQRRHQQGYIDTIKRIHDGEIGEIVGGRCAWNDQGIWFKPRKSNDTDLSYQINNWYHFLWLCGDHVVEQHVHNLDVMNWALGSHPVRATGMGGRSFANRKQGDPKEVGQIWDHFAMEFTYPGDVTITSTCAHVPGIASDISETVVGTKGRSLVSSYRIGKKKVYDKQGDLPYVQEHVDLIKSIKAGTPLNELKAVAESTMTAILGRTAAYSGQSVTWEQVLNAKTSTMPEHLSEKSEIAVTPAPVPGKYKVA